MGIMGVGVSCPLEGERGVSLSDPDPALEAGGEGRREAPVAAAAEFLGNTNGLAAPLCRAAEGSLSPAPGGTPILLAAGAAALALALCRSFSCAFR